jgi:peptidoglycan/LPS O-acetylase OafA/YrhL
LDLLNAAFWTFVPERMLSLRAREFVGAALEQVSELQFPCLLFPATVAALALLEDSHAALGAKLRFLGDMSYSSYLLHIPLEIAFAFVAFSFGLPDTVFLAPGALLLFMAVLTGLSLLSWRHFERPAQTWLRRRFAV